MQYALWQIQQAFDGLYTNLDVPGLAPVLRGPIALWSRLNALGTPPDDTVGHRVAQAMQVPGAQRDRHTSGLYVSDDPHDPLGRLERALRLCTSVEGIERHIRDAVKAGTLKKARPEVLVKKAVEAGIISADEATRLAEAEQARADAIEVDAFTLESYMASAVVPQVVADAEPEMPDLVPDPPAERVGVL